MQRVRPAEGLRDTAHVGALRAGGARNDLDVVALSPLELGKVRHVRLNPAKPGQVEVADVRDFHSLRTLNNEPPPGWTTHKAQGYGGRDLVVNPPQETTDPKVLLDATPASSCVKRHAGRLATREPCRPRRRHHRHPVTELAPGQRADGASGVGCAQTVAPLSMKIESTTRHSRIGGAHQQQVANPKCHNPIVLRTPSLAQMCPVID